MTVNVFIENQVYKGLSLGISDCKIQIEVARDLNIGIGDEFDFSYHDGYCDDGDVETNPICPKYIRSIECFDAQGNVMDNIVAWKTVLYEKTLVITKRVIKADSKIELKGKLV